MDRLGDWKIQAQESAQNLIQILLKECVGKPQHLMSRILETCLVHKNWRVKEQGLYCLIQSMKMYEIILFNYWMLIAKYLDA